MIHLFILSPKTFEYLFYKGLMVIKNNDTLRPNGMKFEYWNTKTDT